MDTRQIVLYWIKEAQEDIPVADHLFAAGDFTYSLFFCHLFIEKLLKALVVARTAAHAPPIHNLIVLAENALLPRRIENLCAKHAAGITPEKDSQPPGNSHNG
jgi:HEPN domain-containing protein